MEQGRTAAMPQMACEYDADRQLFVVLHTANPPSTTEWAGYMDVFRRLDHRQSKQLIFTDGGSPNAQQRQEVNDVLKGRTTTAAVISSSMMVRGVVNALVWFNPRVRIFSPGAIGDAFRHLGVTSEADIANVWDMVARAHTKLGAELKSLGAALPR
jgi:hypothetical protein